MARGWYDTGPMPCANPPRLPSLLLAAALAAALQWLAGVAAVDGARGAHMDEAVYMLWGRQMAHQHDWFLRHPLVRVDKPPLLPLAVSAAFTLERPGLATAMVPSRLAGIAAGVAVFALGARLAGPLAGWLAVVLLGTSWFWEFYVHSVFTDAGLGAATTAALAAAWAGAWGWAGGLAAAAAGCKQFGLLAVVAVLLLAARPGLRGVLPPGRVPLRRALRGLALGLTPLVVWELANRNPFLPWRPGGGPNLVGLDLAHAGADFWFWVRTLSHATAIPPLLALPLGALALADPNTRRGTALLGGALAGYLALLALTPIPEWERYLAFLLPVWCLLQAIGLDWVCRRAAQRAGGTAAAAALVAAALVASLALRQWATDPFRAPEYPRRGALEFMASALARTRPPAVLLVPLDLKWECLDRLVAGGRYATVAFYEGTPDAVPSLLHRFPYRPIHLVAAHSLFSPGTLRAFDGWQAAHPGRASLIQDWREENGLSYALWKVPPGRLAPRRPPAAERLPGPDAVFGAGLRLAGAGTRRGPGGVTLILDWICLQRPDRDWTIRVRLLDAGRRTLAILDHDPADGLSPARLWRPGDRVRDPCDAVPAETWNRTAVVRIGVTDWLTGRASPLTVGGAEAEFPTAASPPP